MYLFSRRTRLVGGHGMAGVEWAIAITAKVNEITGRDIQLWSNVHSPGTGTITWTAWLEDLTAMESMVDQVNADTSFQELAGSGFSYTNGLIDDGILQPLAGAPDPARSIQYATGITAIITVGNLERAMGLCIELAQHSEKVTGLPTVFGRTLTGPYGSVGWLTGYESIAELERSNEAMDADADMLALIDGTKGCFVEDAGAAQTTLYRKVA